MAKQKQSLSAAYLLGNARALKLLGALFISLVDSRRKKNDPKVSIRIFMAMNINSDAERTWARWADLRNLNLPFMGGHLKKTEDCYKWAYKKHLISEDEKNLFIEIFNLLINPVKVFEDSFTDNLYGVFSDHVMLVFCDSTIEDREGTGYFINEKTGVAVDLVTLRTKSWKDGSSKASVEMLARRLARKLLSISRRFALDSIDHANQISYDFLDLLLHGQANEKAGTIEEQLATKTQNDKLRDLRKSKYIQDVVVSQLMIEGRDLVKRLLATCGKTEAKAQIDLLKRHCTATQAWLDQREAEIIAAKKNGNVLGPEWATYPD